MLHIFKTIPLSKTTKIFGDKKTFAFEIEQGINQRKGYLRIWIEDSTIGDFKRQSEFIHAITDFKKLIRTVSSLYEDVFDNMSPKEIYNYVLAEKLVNSEIKTDWQEAERRRIYIRFFGDQFDHLCSFLSLINAEILILIVSFHGNINTDHQKFAIKLQDYIIANEQFLNWFNENLAPFYPFYKT